MKQTPESTADYLDRHMIEAMKELAKERFNPNKRQTMKQTAVEWLIEQLIEMDKQLDGRRKNEDATVIKMNPTKIYEQAKAMEKEQMIGFAEFVARYPDKNRNYLGQMLHARSKYDGAERTVDLLEEYYNETCNK
jgi:hypothetical protein